MASSEVDPLLALRQSIASNSPFTPTTSERDSMPDENEVDLAKATHLFFTSPTHHSVPLDTPTRFISGDKPVDLRSIYFAWLNKDVAIPDYIAQAQRHSEELSAPGGAGGKVQNLVFVERLDLITWLEGASDESEYITPLESDAAGTATAGGAADVVSGIAAKGGLPSGPSGAAPGGQVGAGKTVDPRLAEIYNSERKLADRNTMLRGIKPTDFSHVRKAAEVFLNRSRNRQGGPPSANAHRPGGPTPAAALVSLPKKPSGRRPEPIILLSPSASSLLRMSNIKSFLDTGIYVAPDSAAAPNLLHISRLLPSLDPSRPFRFILVDTPEQFKPDYWSRVVAVFTTGQTWQFKGYKWQSPPELFKNVLGLYVGWRGEDVPATVKGWGRGVMSTAVETWNPHSGAQTRWRDREVVEGIWGAIEESMKARGWTRDAAPTR